MLFSPLSYRTEPFHFPFIPHIKDDCSGYLSSMYAWSFGDRDHFSFSRSRQESVLSSHFFIYFRTTEHDCGDSGWYISFTQWAIKESS